MKKLLASILVIIIIAVPAWSKEHGAILFYDSPFAFVDNQTVFMPAPVTVINGQAMIPLDFMANLTGSKVSYDNGYIWVYHNERDKPKVYFNKEAKQPLLDLINNAKKTIWIEMYRFTYDDILNPLLDASKKNHVEINIILDNVQSHAEIAKVMTDAGIHVKYDWKSSDFHRKLAVFDEKIVWTGSTNWSDAGFNDNAEIDLKVDDPELAKDILARIEDDWKNFAKDSLPVKP